MGDGSISQTQIADFKETFSLFDKDDDGLVELAQLPLLIRSLNVYPTEAELKAIMEEIEAEGNDFIDFPEFVSIISKQIKKQPADLEEELLEAFKVLDKDKVGYIQGNQLKYQVQNLGEQLNDEDAE